MINVDGAVAELCARRIAKQDGARLDKAVRPSNLDEAIAVQQGVTETLVGQHGYEVGAWKCLLPTADKMFIGPIFKHTISRGDAVAILPTSGQAAIEPELAFVFKDSLPVRDTPYTQEEVYAAIGEVRIALELMKSRFADNSECGFVELLADGLLNQGLYLGPQVAATPAEIDFLLTVGTETKAVKGEHPNQDPMIPLHWLANKLNELGLGIEAGQPVITGSYAGILHVAMNQKVTIAYQGLAEMTMTFSELS